MDSLSAALAGMHIERSLLARFDLRDPWSVDCEDGPAAPLHAILEGECWLLYGTAEPIRLVAGDLVLLPRWGPHVLCSDSAITPITISEALKRAGQVPWRPDSPVEWPIDLVHGGSSAAANRVEIVSVLFEIGEPYRGLLLEELPSLVHLRADQNRFAPWLTNTVNFIRAELSQGEPGYTLAANRLSELLLVQVIRAIVALQLGSISGGLRGLADPRIGAALAAAHRFPGSRWTVSRLASEAGMSRTAFAERFRCVVGETPMEYIKKWRMHVALAALAKGSSVKAVAKMTGYATPFGFTKAFKDQFATAPSACRPARK